MKKVISSITIFFIVSIILSLQTSLGQSPQKMSYQAVIRDNLDHLVNNHLVGIKITILQGSVTGTEVYTETQVPTTNASGLISIEIGGGAGFSTIDWSAGPYFLKTETDPAGGTNYTITGTSQLLSVPFSLYSNSSGSYNETDPVFTASPSNGITGTNITNWNNSFSWGNHANAGYTPATRSLTINGTAFDLASNRSWNVGSVTSISTGNGITGGPITSTGLLGLNGQALALHNLNTNGFIVRTGSGLVEARTIIAGSGIKITDGDGISGNPAIAAKTYSVGDFAQGGIVFWVDETGQHGLVCAKTDQSTGIRWYAGTNGNTRAYGDGPYAGKANTAIIIAAQVAIGDDGEPYAAQICNELQITEGAKTYADWYLPSKAELNLIYLNKSAINTTASANGGTPLSSFYYWCSTEYSSYGVWAQSLYSGDNSGYFDKYDTSGWVRAVRAF
jgi:hypothetical protein